MSNATLQDWLVSSDLANSNFWTSTGYQYASMWATYSGLLLGSVNQGLIHDLNYQ